MSTLVRGMRTLFAFIVLLLFSLQIQGNEFKSFYQAKKYLNNTLSSDATTLYCGCKIDRQGKKLVPEVNSCGYSPRRPYTHAGKPNSRAHRIEWEHIVSAWEFGHQLRCWQDGGRKNCRKISAQFRKMESDINNLAPAIGEINGDRSNYRFAMLTNTDFKHGDCPVKINFKKRAIEPPDFAKKRIADAYFYMQKTYGLKLSKKQQQLFTIWQTKHAYN